MESWENTLEAERLRLSSPEAVYAYLSALGPEESGDEENIEDTTLDALLARNNDLIDLGLARFSSNWEKLEGLWQKSPMLRLALLSNRNRGPIFPRNEFAKILTECSDDELQALLTNPAVYPWILTSVFSNSEKLPVDRWVELAKLAISNERLTYIPGSDTWNEFTDAMDHSKPIKAIWDLYIRAEPTAAWCSVLEKASRIRFDVNLPKSYLPDLSTKEGLEEWDKTSEKRYEAFEKKLLDFVTEKWKSQPSSEDEAEETGYPHFFARAAFSCAVSRRGSYRPLIKEFEDHPDLAIRHGYYNGIQIYPDWPIQKFFDRDGLKFIDAVIWNDTLYERDNVNEQRSIRRLAYDREHSDDVRLDWMKGQLKWFVEKDPLKYGDEPPVGMEDKLLNHALDELDAEIQQKEKEGWWKSIKKRIMP